MKNGKHAYLILAHNNFVILEKLILSLDDARNDIYIHINKKVRNFNPEHFLKLVKYSRLVFIKRIRNDWGAYSQIKAELSLIKAAVQTGYDYYHYISGVDFPLKTQDYIHDFFDKNYGTEFVHFVSDELFHRFTSRVKYYHFFQGRKKSKAGTNLLRLLRIGLVLIQKLLGVNRLKKQPMQMKMGSDWFSITDSLARYILSKEAVIKKTFRYTSIGDEIFIQTIVWNSPYRDKLYDLKFDNNYRAILRYIDWNRGRPYVWRTGDYEELMNSGFIFARKFDSAVDLDIVNRIFDHIKGVGQPEMIT